MHVTHGFNIFLSAIYHFLVKASMLCKEALNSDSSYYYACLDINSSYVLFYFILFLVIFRDQKLFLHLQAVIRNQDEMSCQISNLEWKSHFQRHISMLVSSLWSLIKFGNTK
jgi:hypothetical protein